MRTLRTRISTESLESAGAPLGMAPPAFAPAPAPVLAFAFAFAFVCVARGPAPTPPLPFRALALVLSPLSVVASGLFAGTELDSKEVWLALRACARACVACAMRAYAVNAFAFAALGSSSSGPMECIWSERGEIPWSVAV